METAAGHRSRSEGARVVSWLAQLLASVLMVATQPAVRAPLPTTTAPPTSSCPQWYGPALDAGWSADDWPTLDRIMWCESRCDPAAHNRSGASGLLQIMPMHWHGRDPFDPAVNLTIGTEVKEAQGWHAWSCY